MCEQRLFAPLRGEGVIMSTVYSPANRRLQLCKMDFVPSSAVALILTIRCGRVVANPGDAVPER